MWRDWIWDVGREGGVYQLLQQAASPLSRQTEDEGFQKDSCDGKAGELRMAWSMLRVQRWQNFNSHRHRVIGCDWLATLTGYGLHFIVGVVN